MSMSDKLRSLVRIPYARANCTHVSMDMIYGPFVCDLCQSTPPMGWLYECQQDRLQSLAQSTKVQSLPIDGTERSTVQEFEELGFSISIIRQVKQGLYTNEQINILRQQKTAVNMLIERQLDANRSANEIDSSKESTPHPNITVRRKKHRTGKKAASAYQGYSAFRANAICNLRCCHKCRPYCRDRVYGSLNAIADNLDTAYAQTPFMGLKLLNPQVVQQLGLKKSAPSSSQQAYSEAGSPSSSFWTTSSSAYPSTRVDTENTRLRSELVSEEAETLQPNVTQQGPSLSSSPIEISVPSANNDSRVSPLRTSNSETNLCPPSNSLVGRLMNLTRSASQRMIPANKPVFHWPLGKKTKASSEVVVPGLAKDEASSDLTKRILGLETIRRVSGSDADDEGDARNTADNVSETESSNSSCFSAEKAIVLSEMAVEEHVPDIITQR